MKKKPARLRWVGRLYECAFCEHIIILREAQALPSRCGACGAPNDVRHIIRLAEFNPALHPRDEASGQFVGDGGGASATPSAAGIHHSVILSTEMKQGVKITRVVDGTTHFEGEGGEHYVREARPYHKNPAGKPYGVHSPRGWHDWYATRKEAEDKAENLARGEVFKPMTKEQAEAYGRSIQYAVDKYGPDWMSHYKPMTKGGPLPTPTGLPTVSHLEHD